MLPLVVSLSVMILRWQMIKFFSCYHSGLKKEAPVTFISNLLVWVSLVCFVFSSKCMLPNTFVMIRKKHKKNENKCLPMKKKNCPRICVCFAWKQERATERNTHEKEIWNLCTRSYFYQRSLRARMYVKCIEERKKSILGVSTITFLFSLFFFLSSNFILLICIQNEVWFVMVYRIFEYRTDACGRTHTHKPTNQQINKITSKFI